ncbi:WD40 repeat-like protein [Hysterangium stoloniferum]|nr:WD40 repeat-like protein [Hysterangium stoloniferum]
MLLQEAVLCATAPSNGTGAGLIALHDIQTGTALASFKQTTSASHSVAYVETKNGIGGLILAAQSDKALLNVFSFQKDQLMSKIVLPEKLTCIAIDPSGIYCAGGTANGRLYLWEARILFSSFEPHYRRVSVLRFTQDGAALVSASDDSNVSVWSMSRLLDEDLQNEIPPPYCSFTEHTLPITDISCGFGPFPSCRIFTSSLDHSVKVWDLSTRTLLTSILFPQSIILLSVDPSERFIFAASHEGSIYQYNLFRKRPDTSNARAIEALGGAGMSDTIRVIDDEAASRRLISVGQSVTALSLSMSSSLLIAGTSSGQICIYDISSHQLLRSINTYKDKGFGITSLATMLKPPDLFGHIRLGDGGVTVQDADPVIPLTTLQRIKDHAMRATHDVPMMLPICSSKSHSSSPLMQEILQEHRYFVQGTDAIAATGASLQSRVSELETEVAKLREQLGAAKGLNDAMWEGVVQKILPREGHNTSTSDVDSSMHSRKRSKIQK